MLLRIELAFWCCPRIDCESGLVRIADVVAGVVRFVWCSYGSDWSVRASGWLAVWARLVRLMRLHAQGSRLEKARRIALDQFVLLMLSIDSHSVWPCCCPHPPHTTTTTTTNATAARAGSSHLRSFTCGSGSSHSTGS